MKAFDHYAFLKRYCVSNIRPNLDTLELFCQQLPTNIRQIDKITKKRHRIERNRWGYRIVINQPTKELLLFLAGKQRELLNGPERYQLIVSRIDIGIEFIVPSSEYAQELQWYFERHAQLKWKRGFGIDDAFETAYWNRSKATRNLVVYNGKPSRTTKLPAPCCRLELRLKRTTVKANRLETISAISNLNPAALFNHHLRWLDFTEKERNHLLDKHIQKQVNKPTNNVIKSRICTLFTNSLAITMPQPTQNPLNPIYELYQNKHYLASRLRSFYNRFNITPNQHKLITVDWSILVPSSLW